MATGSRGRVPHSPPLRWSNWNLLLLVPLFTLITPLYNHDEPRLVGMPFFYWFQFVGIPVGVTCTLLVYFKTRERPAKDEERAS